MHRPPRPLRRHLARHRVRPCAPRASRLPRPARGFTLVEVLVALTIMAVMAGLSWRAIDGMARAQAHTRQHADGVLALQAGLAQWRADLDALAIWRQAPALPPPQQRVPPPGTPPGQAPDAAATLAARSLAWDGRVLRLTRTASVPLPAPASLPGAAPPPVRATPLRLAGEAAPPGAALPLPASALHVVAWTRSPAGQWWRWQSPPLHTWGDWASAWDSALRWGQTADTPGAATASGGQAVPVAAVLDWQLHYFLGNAWFNPLSSTAQGASQRDMQRLPEAVRLHLTLAPGQAISGPLALDWVSPHFTPVGDQS
ncbi:MAG: prepilin-type N-terminal cleavage/methylation domain-containing protein [Comamonadaceae bacterium]|nr:prepilin-type N-terminal cleavage/methylation domain-containing protein [Comamonadaceae bacterium]